MWSQLDAMAFFLLLQIFKNITNIIDEYFPFGHLIKETSHVE